MKNAYMILWIPSRSSGSMSSSLEALGRLGLLKQNNNKRIIIGQFVDIEYYELYGIMIIPCVSKIVAFIVENIDTQFCTSFCKLVCFQIRKIFFFK